MDRLRAKERFQSQNICFMFTTPLGICRDERHNALLKKTSNLIKSNGFMKMREKAHSNCITLYHPCLTSE